MWLPGHQCPVTDHAALAECGRPFPPPRTLGVPKDRERRVINSGRCEGRAESHPEGSEAQVEATRLGGAPIRKEITGVGGAGQQKTP